MSSIFNLFGGTGGSTRAAKQSSFGEISLSGYPRDFRALFEFRYCSMMFIYLSLINVVFLDEFAGPTESVLKSTIFENARPAPGKNALLTPAKPKGLSIRSKSEINVLRPTGNGERSPRKRSPNKALAKVYLGASECVSLPVSPRNKSSKVVRAVPEIYCVKVEKIKNVLSYCPCSWRP